MMKESPDGTLPSAVEVMEKWINIRDKISPADRKRPLLCRGDQPNDSRYTIDATSTLLST